MPDVSVLSRPGWRFGAAAAVVLAVVLVGCGGVHGGSGGGAHRTGVRSASVAVQLPPVVAQLRLGAGEVTARLPARSWAVSFDVWLARGASLTVGLGYGGGPLTLSGVGAGLRVSVSPGHSYAVRRSAGWLAGGWWHLEATNTRLAIDGRSLPVRASSSTSVTFDVKAGRPRVEALVSTAAADRGLLLLHRLAELHARVPFGQFPVGATLRDGIVFGSRYWTSGFWPGALWQAAALAPEGGVFARWALSSTLAHLGGERADTHDVGFMYGQSSLAAWTALCRGQRSPRAVCPRLRRSVLAAADELLALAASNPGAGTIPTDAISPDGDTIIDSMMNIAILPWASRISGNAAYARLASHQAWVIARLLVRPDGSTAQAVDFDRSTGRVISIGTHQGLSNSSTWSRGEGWALYGFAQAASDLRDRGLLRVALRVAKFVVSHLPAGAVPLWDYNAPPGAPVDVSAGVITAGGMFRLASACRVLRGSCEPGGWIRVGRRMLSASLARAGAEPPLGFLGSQILNERGRGCWCDGGELIFGLTYALEGLRWEGAARG